MLQEFINYLVKIFLTWETMKLLHKVLEYPNIAPNCCKSVFCRGDLGSLQVAVDASKSVNLYLCKWPNAALRKASLLTQKLLHFSSWSNNTVSKMLVLHVVDPYLIPYMSYVSQLSSRVIFEYIPWSTEPEHCQMWPGQKKRKQKCFCISTHELITHSIQHYTMPSTQPRLLSLTPPKDMAVLETSRPTSYQWHTKLREG